MAQFKVKDLMVNAVSGAGAGSAGLFIDTPPTPATPITPVAAVTAYSAKFKAVDKLLKTREVDGVVLDRVAVDIGRAVLGARAVALCTEDMPTCANDPLGTISRVADTYREVLRTGDFAVMTEAVTLAHKAILEADKQIKTRLAPELREALGKS